MADNKGKQNKILIAIIAVLSVAIIGLLVMIFGKDKKKEDNKTTTESVTEVTTEATGTDATESEASEEEKKEDIKEQADCYVSVTNSNSWESQGGYSGQLDSTITNKTGSALSNWKIVMTVPSGTTMDSSWNGTVSLNETSLEITCVDYNGEIPANGSIGDIGIILTAPKQEDLKAICDSAKLYIDGKEYKTSDSKEEAPEEKQEEKQEMSDNTPAKSESGTPVKNHGKLSVKGTDIVDKNGEKYQLKGVSTHGLAWFPQYVDKACFQSFRDDFGANLVRLAMYSGENGGYCTGGDKEKLKGLVESGVSYATELGMYVIIDWHVLGDQNPQVYKEEAKVFFEEMSAKYKDYENVLYEICNEPNGGTSWSDVKSYSEEVIPIIRANDKDAIIIVGTPNWSQDVDIAAEDPVSGYDNIMYAAHFYAATHTDNIRNKVSTALSKGLPIFISEFSICDASGNGSIDYTQAEKWFDLIEENNLSYAAWNISNKDETSSLIQSSCTKTSGWSDDELSETGIWLKKQMSGQN